ncbi:MAG: hypothetical protein WBN17_14020 [Aureibaculum sp.]
MIKVFDFCILKFYDNYVISIINEGVTVSKDISDKICQTAINYYQGKPFVYITHRIHSYSVDPSVYHDVSKIKNLAGFVVVSESKLSIKNALLEKIFLNKPFQIFSNLEDAVLWAENAHIHFKQVK